MFFFGFIGLVFHVFTVFRDTIYTKIFFWSLVRYWLWWIYWKFL